MGLDRLSFGHAGAEPVTLRPYGHASSWTNDSRGEGGACRTRAREAPRWRLSPRVTAPTRCSEITSPATDRSPAHAGAGGIGRVSRRSTRSPRTGRSVPRCPAAKDHVPQERRHQARHEHRSPARHTGARPHSSPPHEDRAHENRVNEDRVHETHPGDRPGITATLAEQVIEFNPAQLATFPRISIVYSNVRGMATAAGLTRRADRGCGQCRRTSTDPGRPGRPPGLRPPSAGRS